MFARPFHGGDPAAALIRRVGLHGGGILRLEMNQYTTAREDDRALDVIDRTASSLWLAPLPSAAVAAAAA